MMKPSKIRNRTMHHPSLALRSKLASSHLSKDLRKTHMRRSIRVVPGDMVSIYRGVYRGITGKVEKVEPGRGIAISGIKREKTEGKKIDIYIHPSNLQVTSLNTDDKWRAKKLKDTGEPKPEPSQYHKQGAPGPEHVRRYSQGARDRPAIGRRQARRCGRIPG